MDHGPVARITLREGAAEAIERCVEVISVAAPIASHLKSKPGKQEQSDQEQPVENLAGWHVGATKVGGEQQSEICGIISQTKTNFSTSGA